MGDFDVVEVGFNSADETINFGTRSIGSATTSLFEICTLACLKSGDESFTGVSDLILNALVNNGHLFLTIEKSIKIFQDTEMSQVIFEALFDSVITCMALTPDQKYLLVCLQTGVVRLFTIDNKDVNCIYSGYVCEMYPQSVHLLDYSKEDEITAQFLLVFQTGLIFRLTVTKNDCEVKSEEIFDVKSRITLSNFSYPYLVTYGSVCNVLNVQSCNAISLKIAEMKKICSLKYVILFLDFNGNLFRLCPVTLTIFPVDYEFLIEDILVLNETESHVLVVTKPNEIGEFFLQLLESDLTLIFSLKINSPVSLVQMDFSKNDIVFMSKILSGDKIIELRLQSVYEADPKSRLMRFIRRRRFEEAEIHAKLFNIDPSVILKAKAQLIIDKSRCTAEDIEMLLTLMDSINDSLFNLHCCKNVDCSNFDDVRKILKYGSKISTRTGVTNGEDILSQKEDILSQKEDILDLLFKFETFMALSTKGDIHSWTNFSCCNLLIKVKEYLQNYKVQDAIIVYSRLNKETILCLNEQYIEEILEMFNNLPMDLYQPFLPTFFRITMTHLPSALHLLIKWILDKVYWMEKRDSYNFPENAIQMVQDMVKLIRVEKSCYVSFQRYCMVNEEIEDLVMIIEGLKILKTLKQNYRIIVELREYLEGPKIFIGTLVKIVMTPDQYDDFLKNFLQTYMLQHDIDKDTIFEEEINSLLQFTDSWIPIIEVILKHLSSVETKLEIIKNILEHGPFPWCEVTKRIARDALHLSHPLTKVIQSIYDDELRLMVIRNPKYGIKKKLLHEEFTRIIHRIIYVDGRQMIDDIFQLCETPLEREKASTILISHLIRKNKLDMAKLVFNKLEGEDRYSCARRLADLAKSNLNCKSLKTDRKETFYSVLPMIYETLIESSKSEHTKQLYKEDFRIIKGVFYFNKELKTTFSSNDFMSSIVRNERYEDLLNTIVDHLNQASPTFPEVLTFSDKVGFHFGKNKQHVLITLCDRLKNLEIMYAAGEYLLENDAEAQSLCHIASLFLKYLGCQKPVEFEISTLENVGDQTLPIFNYVNQEDDSCKNDFHVNSLRLAEKLTTKAQMKADSDDILCINELNNWINICYFLSRKKSTVHDKLFKTLYYPKESSPSNFVLSSIRDCFLAYTRTLDKKTCINFEYLAVFPGDAEEISMNPLKEKISELPTIIDIFCREGKYFTAFSLLRTLSNCLYLHPSNDKSILKPVQTIILKSFLPNLMHAVVSAQYIDLKLLHNLLIRSRTDVIHHLYHYIKTHKRNPRKFRDLSIVGIWVLDFLKDTSGKSYMMGNVKTCHWWKKLPSVRTKIIYDEFFKSDADTRLKSLINLEALGIQEIIEYCADFKLPVEMYFKEYLRSSLINWKPEYEVNIVNGRRILVMKSNEESLHTKCQNIISYFEGKEGANIIQYMEKMIKEVNFYHYEVFLTVYKIIENNLKVSNDKYIDMLHFLKSYTRYKGPSLREKEEWYIRFVDSQVLDALSEFRLPFSSILFTSDVWSIIRPEVSLKTYRRWFDATDILKKNFKTDDICVYAIKELVSSGTLGGDGVSKDWILYSKFEDIINEVDECAKNIYDLERATSAVYHLMNNLPDGADKVKAAELSLKYASDYRNRNLNNPDIERAYIKVKNKYFGLSTCHILHKYNLASDNYLKLVTQPQALIEALYTDERILTYAGTFCLNYLDINNAVEAVSDLFGLDVLEIRMDLLNLWLDNSGREIDMDTTSYFIPVVPKTLDAINDEDILKRAIYICSSSNRQSFQSYLLKVGLDEEDEEHKKTVACKAKALKCFVAITDTTTLHKLTNVSYYEFLNYIDKLTLLSDLENLGIFLDIEPLNLYNKKELLKKLSNMGKPLAIKCMGAICITYFLEEPKYWKYIIDCSIKLGMTDELKIYVEFLKDKCDEDFYIKAWQALIDKYFHQISDVSNEKDLEERLLENFLTIQSCPVSFSINYEKIIQKCITLGKHEYAALLLQYMPEKSRKSVDKDFLRSESSKSKMEILQQKGLWGVRNVGDLNL